MPTPFPTLLSVGARRRFFPLIVAIFALAVVLGISFTWVVSWSRVGDRSGAPSDRLAALALVSWIAISTGAVGFTVSRWRSHRFSNRWAFAAGQFVVITAPAFLAAFLLLFWLFSAMTSGLVEASDPPVHSHPDQINAMFPVHLVPPERVWRPEHGEGLLYDWLDAEVTARHWLVGIVWLAGCIYIVVRARKSAPFVQPAAASADRSQ